MLQSDFLKHNINNFTGLEISKTGAVLKDVKVEFFIGLQHYRNLINRRVKLIFNGLTTGKHKSPEHPNGIAGDIFHHPSDGPLDYKKCYYLALESGFHGIGIYYNKEINLYVFHFDLGRFRSWSAFKNKKHDKWKYASLLVNPAYLKFDVTT